MTCWWACPAMNYRNTVDGAHVVIFFASRGVRNRTCVVYLSDVFW